MITTWTTVNILGAIGFLATICLYEYLLYLQEGRKKS